ILGKNEGGQSLARYFRAHERNYHFEGYLTERDDLLLTDRGEITESTRRQFQRAIAQGIQEVYVSLPSHRIGQAAVLVEEGERHCLRVKLVPDLTREDKVPYRISVLGPVPVISVRQEPVYDIEGRFKKRLFDVLFSLFAVVFILSWLYPSVAFLIKRESAGPVLFKQQRTGRESRPCQCYPSRSRRGNGGSDDKPATRDECRVTGIGACLRRSRLDELRRFLSALHGHRSVVGPHPHMRKHTKKYS